MADGIEVSSFSSASSLEFMAHLLKQRDSWLSAPPPFPPFLPFENSKDLFLARRGKSAQEHGLPVTDHWVKVTGLTLRDMSVPHV